MADLRGCDARGTKLRGLGDISETRSIHDTSRCLARSLVLHPRLSGRGLDSPATFGIIAWAAGEIDHMRSTRGRCCWLRAPVRAVLAILGLFAITTAIPAVAQTPPAQSPSTTAARSPATCELHIWPAATTHTTFQGWVRAGAVDGARRGVKGYPDLHAGALDTGQQARLLGAIDWRSAFADPALVVVVHTAPTGPDDDRSRTTRLVAEASPCYRELIIANSIVESEVFSKLSVRILGLRKRFDGAGSAPANFSSMSEAAVLFSDADKGAGDSGARMDAAVQAAFVSAVNKFAVMQSFH